MGDGNEETGVGSKDAGGDRRDSSVSFMVAEDFYHRLGRTKSPDLGSTSTEKRLIGTYELALFGLSNMVGAGIYMLGGSVARDSAGPAATLSFLLAALLVMPSALCGAELASRQPRAASVYSFVYVTVGEFCAFFVGWTSLLRSAMASAAVAQAWSGCLDFLLDHRLSAMVSRFVSELHLPMDRLGLPSSPDVPAAVVLLVTAAVTALSRGLVSSHSVGWWAVGTALQALNVSSMLLAVSLGVMLGDVANWVPFAPYGWKGVAAGAAAALFAFGGWDCMLGASSRTKQPAAAAVPTAVSVSVAAAAVQYCCFCGALTLLAPWDTLAPAAAFSSALHQRLAGSWASAWAPVLVAAGSLGAMCATLSGALAQGGGALRAMAADGLIPSSVASVITGSVPSAVLAALVKPAALVQLLSLCTLVSYACCCGTLLLARVVREDGGAKEALQRSDGSGGTTGLFLPGIAVTLLALSGGSGAFLLRHHLLEGHWPTLLAGVGSAFVALASVAILWVLQQMAMTPSAETNSFRIPLAPLLPSLLLCSHVGLSTFLQPRTWLLYGIWITFGVVVYLAYGCTHSRHSTEFKLPAHTELRRDSLDKAFGA